MSSTFISILKRPLVPLAVIALCVLVLVVAALVDPDASPGRAESAGATSEVTLVSGLEATSSRTLADWTGVADYVVTASVVAERKLTAPRSETTDTADELVGREIDLTISKVLWRSPGTRLPAPRRATMPALGWHRDGSGVLRELAPEQGARLEVGHQYVLALVWAEAECAPGDRNPARWSVIGSGGAIPADAGALGTGEFEGTALARGQEARLGAQESVARRFAAGDVGRLVSALASASPRNGATFQSGNTRGCTG